MISLSAPLHVIQCAVHVHTSKLPCQLSFVVPHLHRRLRGKQSSCSFIYPISPACPPLSLAIPFCQLSRGICSALYEIPIRFEHSLQALLNRYHRLVQSQLELQTEYHKLHASTKRQGKINRYVDSLELHPRLCTPDPSINFRASHSNITILSRCWVAKFYKAPEQLQALASDLSPAPVHYVALQRWLM